CAVLRLVSHAAASTGSHTLSLHDALPICRPDERRTARQLPADLLARRAHQYGVCDQPAPGGSQRGLTALFTRGSTPIVGGGGARSEEHTSELQSRENLVCRLLLEKKQSEQ